MSSTFRPPPRAPPESLQAWQRLAEESVIDDFGPSKADPVVDGRRHEGYHSVNERGPASPAAAKSQASGAEAEGRTHQGVNWTLKDAKMSKMRGKKIHVEDPRSGRLMDKTRTQNAWDDMHHPACWKGPRDTFENDPGPLQTPRTEDTVETSSDPKGVYAGGFNTREQGKKQNRTRQERTNSCIFPANQVSPNDRLFPTQKRSQKAVYDEEKGGVLVNLHKVSAQGPSHMKSLQDEKLDDGQYRERHREAATVEMLNSARGRQANAGMRTDHAARQDRRGIKTQIKQESGHIMNQTIVSVNSPDFMKKPFENNLAFFKEQGIVQKLTPKGEGNDKPASTIHFDNSRNPVAGVRNSLNAQDETSKLRHHITDEGNTKVWHRGMESRGKPLWMQQAASDTGEMAQEDLHRSWVVAGVDSGGIPRGKRAVVVHGETGKVMHRTKNSAATPAWMKLGAVGAEHHAKDMNMQKISGRILDEDDELELAVAHGQSNSGIRILTECAVTGNFSLGEKFCHSKHAPDWFHGATLTSQEKAKVEADLRSPNRHHNSSTMSSESCQSVASERKFVARLAKTLETKVNTSQKLKKDQTSTKTTSTRRSSSCSRSRRTSDATSYRSKSCSGLSRSTCSTNQSRRSSDLTGSRAYSDWTGYASSLPVQKEKKKANDQCDSPRRHGHR